MPAINLEQAIRAFHPAPLSGNELRLYYVERPYSPLRRMEIQLRNQRRLKVIFSGHRGSGKSTALNCLCERLADAFIPVPVSVQQDMSAYDVHYVDILLTMAARLLQHATDEGAMPRPIRQVIQEDLLDYISRWFEKVIDGLQFAPRSGEKSLQAQVNLWAIQLQAKLKDETETRVTLRERVSVRLADLLVRMNLVIGEMERQSNKQVLFAIEDIDKLDIEKARNLFLGYGRSLTAPSASIIYTFPAALRYTTDWPYISQNYFGWHEMLPNVALTNKEGAPLPSGRRVLEQIIYRRLDQKLITPNALKTLISDSGGLVGTLIRLMLIAITYALEKNRDAVDVESARSASSQLRGDFKALLRPQDYDILRTVLRGEDPPNTEAKRDALYTGALLEYQDGEPWVAVHPLVRPLIEETKSP